MDMIIYNQEAIQLNYYVYENTPIFTCELREIYHPFNMRCSHYHSGFEIIFMIKGDRYVFLNNGLHHVKRGDIVIFCPYQLHHTVSHENLYFKRYVLNFSNEIFSSLFSEKETSCFLHTVASQIIHIDEKYMTIMEDMFEEFLKYNNNSDILTKKIIAAKLITLLDGIKKIPVPVSGSASANMECSSGFAYTLNYINNHFKDDLTLDFISEYAHMSKTHFCRVFKKETKTTFLQYINNLRIAYAHNLLIETDRSINTIAENAGFSSLLHFERVFKQIHGITPSAMRKRHHS